MASFSKTSIKRLSTCHPELQILFNYVIQFYDCTIVCGTRGEEEQNNAYNAGASTKKFPNSKHNSMPSLAVDVAPYEKTGIDWGKKQSAHFAGFVMGIAEMLYSFGYMSHKIRSGADWDEDDDIDDTTFWDACHFEIKPK